MKVLEYSLLERILPVLQEHGHPALNQTAYQKHISCQDAIFATQETIQKSLQEGEISYLSLYDLEKHLILSSMLYSSIHSSKQVSMAKPGGLSGIATAISLLLLNAAQPSPNLSLSPEACNKVLFFLPLSS